MNFRIGQKVVCIGAEWEAAPQPGEVFPSIGVVYTIRGITVDRGGASDAIGLYFDGLVNPPRICGNFPIQVEPSFGHTKFRPVIERKTDISIFTAMLNLSRQPAKV